MTPLWQLFISGAVGSSLAFVYTWLRERKRTQDAYRTPQRQAIGDIVAAAHELQLRILHWRRALTSLTEVIREYQMDLAALRAEVRETESAYATAVLGLRRAFEVGSLTVVDVDCWQDMVVAVAAFSRFDELQREVESAEDAEQFVAELDERAAELRAAVSALVRTASARIAPTEPRRNRRKRGTAQRQLAEHLGGDTTQSPDETQGG